MRPGILSTLTHLELVSLLLNTPQHRDKTGQCLFKITRPGLELGTYRMHVSSTAVDVSSPRTLWTPVWLYLTTLNVLHSGVHYTTTSRTATWKYNSRMNTSEKSHVQINSKIRYKLTSAPHILCSFACVSITITNLGPTKCNYKTATLTAIKNSKFHKLQDSVYFQQINEFRLIFRCFDLAILI
jgi:hypothetical protein